MRVHILEGKEQESIRLRIDEPMSNVPDWILISAAKSKKPSLLLPDGHHFAASQGRFGFATEVLTTAKAYVAGKIDNTEAARRFEKSLAGWSRISSTSAVARPR